MLACNKMLMQKLICLLVFATHSSRRVLFLFTRLAREAGSRRSTSLFMPSGCAMWLHFLDLAAARWMSCWGENLGDQRTAKSTWTCTSITVCLFATVLGEDYEKLWPAPEILDEDQTSFGVNRFSRKKTFSVIKFVWRPACAIDVLPPSRKECNYEIHVGQSSSSLTKFIANNINIYVSI